MALLMTLLILMVALVSLAVMHQLKFARNVIQRFRLVFVNALSVVMSLKGRTQTHLSILN